MLAARNRGQKATLRFYHTLTTELMKSPGRDFQLVKGLLGHRSVSTTMEDLELDKLTFRLRQNALMCSGFSAIRVYRQSE